MSSEKNALKALWLWITEPMKQTSPYIRCIGMGWTGCPVTPSPSFPSVTGTLPLLIQSPFTEELQRSSACISYTPARNVGLLLQNRMHSTLYLTLFVCVYSYSLHSLVFLFTRPVYLFIYIISHSVFTCLKHEAFSWGINIIHFQLATWPVCPITVWNEFWQASRGKLKRLLNNLKSHTGSFTDRINARGIVTGV